MYKLLFKLCSCVTAFHWCTGDLLYLELTTLEGVHFFVTACPSGFYLNKSQSSDLFDPTAKKTHHLNKHLNGLLSQVIKHNTFLYIDSLLHSCCTDQPSVQEELCPPPQVLGHPPPF